MKSSSRTVPQGTGGLSGSQSIERLPEVQKDFYAEVPFQLELEGNYHGLAMFFDRDPGLFEEPTLVVKDQRSMKRHFRGGSPGGSIRGTFDDCFGGRVGHSGQSSLERSTGDRIEACDQWECPTAGGPGVVVGHLAQWQNADQCERVGWKCQQFDFVTSQGAIERIVSKS